MIYWIIGVLVYLVIAYFAYAKIIKNWDGHSQFEKIYFSLIWILILPLYGIHWIHNQF